MQRKMLWLLIPIPIISILFFIILMISLGVPIQPFSEEHCGCHQMAPNYLYLIIGILLISATIPLSYYFSSKKMEEKLNKHVEFISKLIYKTKNKQKSNKRVNKKNASSVNKQTILKFLNTNERKVLEGLLESKGSILQSEISRMGSMTKVRTHRAVKSLEQKGIIRIERYGKTNKIFLTEDIKDLLTVF